MTDVPNSMPAEEWPSPHAPAHAVGTSVTGGGAGAGLQPGTDALAPGAELNLGESVRVEAKGQGRYWTVEDGRVLVGRTLPEVVSAMSQPRLSLGAMSAFAGRRASIWLSPFENVHRLTFGHELLVTATGPQVNRWLRPELAPEARGEPEVVMWEAITRAIDDATRGHSGATVALSAGLDSTILLALAARLPRLRDGLRACCAAPDHDGVLPVRGRCADEWPDASSVAALARVPVRRLLDEDRFNWLELADDVHKYSLMPVLGAANLWWLRKMNQMAVENGHGIVLTGQSGNATFSNGRPSAPQPLRADGTWDPGPRSWRRLHTLRTLHRRKPPSALRPEIPVTMPDHVLDMAPWTRFCLVEPFSTADRPRTSGDVAWKDPLGSPEVITAAHSLPAAAWGAKGSDRTIARQVGRGLIPEHVRLSQVRGVQGADMPGTLLAHADSYVDAVDRVRQSPTAREFLDTDVLSRGLDLLRGDLRSARVFQQHYLRPLAVGLFAAWWDERPSIPRR